MSESAHTPADGTTRRSSSQIHKHPLTFSAQGSEYFRVWLVNVVLTVLTLGIFTPYARRRTATYFYNHSHVAGSPLTFSASAKRMMFGFLVVTALYLTYELAVWLENDLAANIILVLAAVAAPFLWGSAMRFRTRATRWRGIRPVFLATWPEIYRQSWPVFAIAAIWLAVVTGFSFSALDEPWETAETMSTMENARTELLDEIDNTDVLNSPRLAELQAELADIESKLEAPPYAQHPSSESAYFHALKRSAPWIVGLLLVGVLASIPFLVLLEFKYRRLFVKRTQIGQHFGHWKPVYADFLRVWLATFALACLMVLVMVLITAAIAWPMLANDGLRQGDLGLMLSLFVGLFMLWMMFLFFALSPILAYREARMFQLMWNNIGLGHKARFKSDLHTWRFVGLRVLNLLLTGITLGLYRPFALVAEYRMKFESVTLYVKGDLNELQAQLVQEQGALGDAFADAMGLDLIG